MLKYAEPLDEVISLCKTALMDGLADTLTLADFGDARNLVLTGNYSVHRRIKNDPKFTWNAKLAAGSFPPSDMDIFFVDTNKKGTKEDAIDRSVLTQVSVNSLPTDATYLPLTSRQKEYIEKKHASVPLLNADVYKTIASAANAIGASTIQGLNDKPGKNYSLVFNTYIRVSKRLSAQEVINICEHAEFKGAIPSEILEKGLEVSFDVDFPPVPYPVKFEDLNKGHTLSNTWYDWLKNIVSAPVKLEDLNGDSTPSNIWYDRVQNIVSAKLKDRHYDGALPAIALAYPDLHYTVADKERAHYSRERWDHANVKSALENSLFSKGFAASRPLIKDMTKAVEDLAYRLGAYIEKKPVMPQEPILARYVTEKITKNKLRGFVHCFSYENNYRKADEPDTGDRNGVFFGGLTALERDQLAALLRVRNVHVEFGVGFTGPLTVCAYFHTKPVDQLAAFINEVLQTKARTA